MSPLRIFLRSRRWLAMMIVAAALCVRALVPAGYMVSSAPSAHSIAIQICTGSTLKSVTLVLPSSHEDRKDHGKQAEAPCAFTALAMGAVESVDPLQLALAISFILLLGFAPQSVTPLRSPAYVRPPLRGPPAFARFSLTGPDARAPRAGLIGQAQALLASPFLPACPSRTAPMSRRLPGSVNAAALFAEERPMHF